MALISGCSKTSDISYLDGTSGNYDDFNGKWLLINYWASWCKPCIKEIPELNALHQQASGKSNIHLLAVNFDNPSLETLKKQSQSFNIQFPQLVGNASKAPHIIYGFEYPKVLPTTVIISPKGEFMVALKGPQTMESLIQQLDKKTVQQ